jgi:transposase
MGVAGRNPRGARWIGRLSEFGIVAGKGKAGLARLIDELRAGTLDLPADAVVAAMMLADQRAGLDAAADALERRITAQAKADERAVMLKTAPGVGPLSAHATLATMPDPSLFKSGRDFAAWLGLTPRIHGTGGKTHSGRITKQGNQPLRRLLVLGATAWLRQVKARPEKASPWLRGMLARRPSKVVAVAQAARTARILWAMLSHNQPYRAPAIG